MHLDTGTQLQGARAWIGFLWAEIIAHHCCHWLDQLYDIWLRKSEERSCICLCWLYLCDFEIQPGRYCTACHFKEDINEQTIMTLWWHFLVFHFRRWVTEGVVAMVVDLKHNFHSRHFSAKSHLKWNTQHPIWEENIVTSYPDQIFWS
jgi:hypothetical protein